MIAALEMNDTTRTDAFVARCNVLETGLRVQGLFEEADLLRLLAQHPPVGFLPALPGRDLLIAGLPRGAEYPTSETHVTALDLAWLVLGLDPEAGRTMCRQRMDARQQEIFARYTAVRAALRTDDAVRVLRPALWAIEQKLKAEHERTGFFLKLGRPFVPNDGARDTHPVPVVAAVEFLAVAGHACAIPADVLASWAVPEPVIDGRDLMAEHADLAAQAAKRARVQGQDRIAREAEVRGVAERTAAALERLAAA